MSRLKFTPKKIDIEIYSDGATWFSSVDGKIVAETPVTTKTKEKPPKWLKELTEAYVGSKVKLKKVS